MNTMDFLVWLLPVFFMLHDFEEIIMSEAWGKRYRAKIDEVWPKRQPFGLKYVHNYQTATFSIGVEVIFLLYVVISFFSVFFQNYFLWFAFLLGLLLHFFLLHFVLCIQFRHYVPGVVTSALFLLPGGWVLCAAQRILRYGASTILFACGIVIVITAVLMPILHKATGPWSIRVEKYANKTNRQ